MILPNSQNNSESDYHRMLHLFYDYGYDNDDNLIRDTDDETKKLASEIAGKSLERFNIHELRGYKDALAALDELFERCNPDHYDSSDLSDSSDSYEV